MSDTKEGSETQDDTQPGLQWNENIDKLLSEKCDEAKCFEWMHGESYSRYSKRAMGMTIATNTIIAISGIANIVVGKISDASVDPSTIFGCISIVISLVNMLQDKFDWLTMANTFKQSANHWGIIVRKIQEQLVIPYSGRQDCRAFLKYIKQDINLISSSNALIPHDIRELCAAKFSPIPQFNVPDICGQVEHTSVFVPSNESVRTPLLTNIQQ